ncbi:MAG: rhomboid family intramembrane serine protease [Candidatus Bathyarchaeia archaeon]
MFPLYDENPSKTRPYVTWSLIALNVIVFVWWVSGGMSASVFDIFGETPAYVLRGERLYTVFTSMFLHGGIAHIFGNMLYLFIFGDNVEDTFGHGKYLILYLFFGVVGGLVHSFVTVTPDIPAVGASGAISGVLGAYVLFFPRARVVSIVPSYFFIRLARIPAVVFIGFWFLLQLLLSGSPTGVAYWAHIGGFVAGFIAAVLYRIARALA